MVDNTNEEVIKLLVGICDDDKIIRKRIRHICEQVLNEKCMEIRIIEFTNGREVIDNEKKIELLILDIEMPGLNGLKALKLLRDQGYGGYVIVKTAYGRFAYAQDALHLHVDAYLLKPVKKAELKERLDEIFRKLQKQNIGDKK